MDQTSDNNRDLATDSLKTPDGQFSLKTLFLLTAAIGYVAACMRIFGLFGFFVAIYGVVLVIWLWHLRFGWSSFRGFALQLITFGICGWLVVSALQYQPQRDGYNTTPLCQNNLRNIGTAILVYTMARDYLPPVYTTDPFGRRLTSWRTLILSRLGQPEIAQKFHPNEPWNSANNLPLCTQIPIYQCPNDSVGQKTNNYTSYVAIVGPGTAWQPGKRITLTDFKDGQTNTILLVEMKSSGIAWSEPRDLDLNNLPPGLKPQNLLSLLSNHQGGFEALFADGHVEFIPSTIPWSQFIALTTIAGGETINRASW